MSVHKSPITCHVLDSSLGRPAAGVKVQLQRHRKISDSDQGEVFAFDPIAHGETNGDGRCMDLLTPRSDSVEDLAILHTGLYKIIFQTKEYFKQTDRDCFYPWVEVTFEILDSNQHYHIPLLLSPYSYTTYRGS
ncbi:transthyretin [Pyrrhoderma noxium]|uniref:5-hydroxyisourate hydrolase n=1 Tax=Pyrrhoderma noxium TaxID=2282107 RepID=A0A286UR73_9AGAM|nr:transthyretin [Pyrrhoderma noxium]